MVEINTWLILKRILSYRIDFKIINTEIKLFHFTAAKNNIIVFNHPAFQGVTTPTSESAETALGLLSEWLLTGWSSFTATRIRGMINTQKNVATKMRKKKEGRTAFICGDMLAHLCLLLWKSLLDTQCTSHCTLKINWWELEELAAVMWRTQCRQLNVHLRSSTVRTLTKLSVRLFKSLIARKCGTLS